MSGPRCRYVHGLATLAVSVLLVVLASCAAPEGAGDTGAAAVPAGDTAASGSSMERVNVELLHRGEQSGYTDSARIVLRSQAELDEAWRRAHVGITPVPASPSVDFESAIVIVAAMGERMRGGFEIAVDTVQRTPGALIVHVTSTRPAENCMVPAVITYPVDVVRVDATAAQVEFREHVVERAC